MKRFLYLIFFISIIFTQNIFSQHDSIPNPGFEVWIDYSDPEPYSVPQGWFTADSVIAKYNQFSTVEKDNNAYSGNYCAQLSSKTINLPFLGNINFPGLLSLGEISMYPLTIHGGIADTLEPHHIRGYYKYAPQNDDSCLISAFITHFIPVKGKRDTIGRAFFKGGAAADWTEFIAPFIYSGSSYLPDTMNILILSSGDTSKINIGSVLWVDDLSVEMSSGIYSDPDAILKASIYPNPAKNYMHIELEEAVENAEIIIYNAAGSQVYKKGCCFGRKYTINTKNYKTGSYYFHLLLGKQKVSSGSFIIIK